MEVRAVRTSPVPTARIMESQILITDANIKQELAYEGQTLKKETNGEEESDTSLVIKRTRTSSTSLSCPDEDGFLYCEKCQMKYEGGCPKHEHLIYLDNDEASQGEGCSQDSQPQDAVADKKERQMARRKKVEQSGIGGTHSDDVETLPHEDCSTESDQMVSECETNTELCVAGTSCESQSNDKTKIFKKMHRTRKTFTCDECGVGFTRCSNLDRHMRAHTGNKPFKCDMCGVGFVESGALIKHNISHTEEKPYKCDVCGSGFSRSDSLKMHKRTHTGEKNYKCDVCGVEFIQKGGLTVHKRTHTGEKPYKCDVCGVGFAVSGGLLRHKKTHTGEKPYGCDVCGVLFSQSGHLKAHKRTHLKVHTRISSKWKEENTSRNDALPV